MAPVIYQKKVTQFVEKTIVLFESRLTDSAKLEVNGLF